MSDARSQTDGNSGRLACQGKSLQSSSYQLLCRWHHICLNIDIKQFIKWERIVNNLNESTDSSHLLYTVFYTACVTCVFSSAVSVWELLLGCYTSFMNEDGECDLKLALSCIDCFLSHIYSLPYLRMQWRRAEPCFCLAGLPEKTQGGHASTPPLAASKQRPDIHFIVSILLISCCLMWNKQRTSKGRRASSNDGTRLPDGCAFGGGSFHQAQSPAHKVTSAPSVDPRRIFEGGP